LDLQSRRETRRRRRRRRRRRKVNSILKKQLGDVGQKVVLL
jgi:hypothetical protein